MIESDGVTGVTADEGADLSGEWTTAYPYTEIDFASRVAQHAPATPGAVWAVCAQAGASVHDLGPGDGDERIRYAV